MQISSCDYMPPGIQGKGQILLPSTEALGDLAPPRSSPLLLPEHSAPSGAELLEVLCCPSALGPSHMQLPLFKVASAMF